MGKFHLDLVRSWLGWWVLFFVELMVVGWLDGWLVGWLVGWLIRIITIKIFTVFLIV